MIKKLRKKRVFQRDIVVFLSIFLTACNSVFCMSTEPDHDELRIMLRGLLEHRDNGENYKLLTESIVYESDMVLREPLGPRKAYNIIFQGIINSHDSSTYHRYTLLLNRCNGFYDRSSNTISKQEFESLKQKYGE